MLKIGGGSGILGVRKKLLILIMVAFVGKDGFIYDIYRVTIVVLYYVLVLSVCSVLMLEM